MLYYRSATSGLYIIYSKEPGMAKKNAHGEKLCRCGVPLRWHPAGCPSAKDLPKVLAKIEKERQAREAQEAARTTVPEAAAATD